MKMMACFGVILIPTAVLCFVYRSGLLNWFLVWTCSAKLDINTDSRMSVPTLSNIHVRAEMPSLWDMCIYCELISMVTSISCGSLPFLDVIFSVDRNSFVCWFDDDLSVCAEFSHSLDF